MIAVLVPIGVFLVGAAVIVLLRLERRVALLEDLGEMSAKAIGAQRQCLENVANNHLTLCEGLAEWERRTTSVPPTEPR